jgi:hypothetical protein
MIEESSREQHSHKLANSRSDDYTGGAHLGLRRTGSFHFKSCEPDCRSRSIARGGSGALASDSPEFIEAM